MFQLCVINMLCGGLVLVILILNKFQLSGELPVGDRLPPIPRLATTVDLAAHCPSLSFLPAVSFFVSSSQADNPTQIHRPSLTTYTLPCSNHALARNVTPSPQPIFLILSIKPFTSPPTTV